MEKSSMGTFTVMDKKILKSIKYSFLFIRIWKWSNFYQNLIMKNLMKKNPKIYLIFLSQVWENTNNNFWDTSNFSKWAHFAL